MRKILLKDLRDKIFRRTALIPLDGLQEILSLSDNYSGDQIFSEIVHKSLQSFEMYHPLVLEMNVYFNPQNNTNRPGYYEFRDNFSLYLDGRLDESQIILIPNSINGIRVTGTYSSAGNYFRAGDYDKPYIQLPMLSQQLFTVRGICSRKMMESYNPDGTYDDKSAVYWMDYDGVLGKIFLDQVLCDTLEHVRNVKANFQLPNYPVDMMSAVDIAYQQTKQELDQYYLQSNWDGILIM